MLFFINSWGAGRVRAEIIFLYSQLPVGGKTLEHLPNKTAALNTNFVSSLYTIQNSILTFSPKLYSPPRIYFEIDSLLLNVKTKIAYYLHSFLLKSNKELRQNGEGA